MCNGTIKNKKKKNKCLLKNFNFRKLKNLKKKLVNCNNLRFKRKIKRKNKKRFNFISKGQKFARFC